MSSLACVHCAHRGVQFLCHLCPSEAVFRGSPGMCTAPRGWLSWCPSCMWRGQPGVRFPQMGEVGQRHPSLGLTARDTHPPKPGMCIATMTTSLRTWALTSKSSAYWKCRTWTVPGGQAARCCMLAQNQSGHPGQARGTQDIRHCCPERLHSPGPSFGSRTAGHSDLGWRNLQSRPGAQM